ncbi:Methylthioribose kinase [Raoultella terrigena]|uniref:Methylthioribose kinase n=1 Tax=Raoultella terrigena TaxID=577 RepID=A0A4U9DEU3_RAOTE|nr:Methylthioribose kinase [Raoultella terrigena]
MRPCATSACATRFSLGKALIVIAERIDGVDELIARIRQYG